MPPGSANRSRARPPSMWRYAPLLPVRDARHIVSLGEGMTPLLKASRLGARIGANDLWVKDEGVNPTGSFKARGLSCAISMCVELGLSQSGHRVRGQCRKRARSLCRRGRNRSARLHAARCSAIQLHRMPRLRSARHVGRRADQRLRAHHRRAQGRRRLVRYQHAQGAVSHRRQEDHGVRSSRAVRLDAARRHLLSHRRRSRPDRNVEGFRRIGSAGLDLETASENDRRAGGGLPAGGARLRAR